MLKRCSGGLKIAVSSYTSWNTFGTLFTSGNAHNFVPTLLYGVVLFVIATRVKSQMALPIAIISALPIFYIIVGCAGVPR
jgi:hypothetical protein